MTKNQKLKEAQDQINKTLRQSQTLQNACNIVGLSDMAHQLGCHQNYLQQANKHITDVLEGIDV